MLWPGFKDLNAAILKGVFSTETSLSFDRYETDNRNLL
jgi:hypothetical protein